MASSGSGIANRRAMPLTVRGARKPSGLRSEASAPASQISSRLLYTTNMLVFYSGRASTCDQTSPMPVRRKTSTGSSSPDRQGDQASLCDSRPRRCDQGLVLGGHHQAAQRGA